MKHNGLSLFFLAIFCILLGIIIGVVGSHGILKPMIQREIAQSGIPGRYKYYAILTAQDNKIVLSGPFLVMGADPNSFEHEDEAEGGG